MAPGCRKRGVGGAAWIGGAVASGEGGDGDDPKEDGSARLLRQSVIIQTSRRSAGDIAEARGDSEERPADDGEELRPVWVFWRRWWSSASPSSS